MKRSRQGDSDGNRGRLNNEAKRVKVDGQSSSQSAPAEARVIPTSLSLQDASDTSKLRRSRARGDRLGQVEITDPALALQDKLTTEEGQLEENPYYTLDQAREAAKREYNRRNAARGRIRRKSLLSDLQDKCTSMESEMQALKRENSALKAEIEEMKQVAAPQQSLDGSGRLINKNMLDISQQGRMMHLPPVGGREISLQYDQIMGHQLVLNNLLHQPLVMGGISTTYPSQLGTPLDNHLQQSLAIARARAALNSNMEPRALPDSTLEEYLGRYPSGLPPK